MKKILITIFTLALVGCGSKNDSSNNVLQKGNSVNDQNQHLTSFEVDSLVGNTWCENDVTVTFRFKQKSVVKRCTKQLQVRHTFSKFSATEYFAKISYVGQRVDCWPNFGHHEVFSVARVNQALKKMNYRVSLINQNRALITKVGSDEESLDVELFVTSFDVSMLPLNKNMEPRSLFNCFD